MGKALEVVPRRVRCQQRAAASGNRRCVTSRSDYPRCQHTSSCACWARRSPCWRYLPRPLGTAVGIISLAAVRGGMPSPLNTIHSFARYAQLRRATMMRAYGGCSAIIGCRGNALRSRRLFFPRAADSIPAKCLLSRPKLRDFRTKAGKQAIRCCSA